MQFEVEHKVLVFIFEISEHNKQKKLISLYFDTIVRLRNSLAIFFLCEHTCLIQMNHVSGERI